jgi:nucleotide-binding universal stress UspA family protein
MKILIANDGSEFGQTALHFAADFICRISGAEVKVVTVIEPAAGTELEMVIESTDDLIDSQNPLYIDASKTAADSAAILKEKCPDENTGVTFEVLAGPPARRIVEDAEGWGADLIVVGTHGRGFWKRALLGSVSNRVMQHASCSVMVVRGEEKQ